MEYAVLSCLTRETDFWVIERRNDTYSYVCRTIDHDKIVDSSCIFDVMNTEYICRSSGLKSLHITFL